MPLTDKALEAVLAADDWLFLTIAPDAVLPGDPATETAVLRRRHHADITVVAGSSA